MKSRELQGTRAVCDAPCNALCCTMMHYVMHYVHYHVPVQCSWTESIDAHVQPAPVHIRCQ